MVMPLSLASPNHILKYTIIDDNVLVNHRTYFSDKQAEIKFYLPPDAEAIEVKKSAFNIYPDAESKVVVVKNPSSPLEIKYVTQSLVEKTKDRYFILNLAKISGDKEVTITLPEGAILKEKLGSSSGSIIPLTSNITTDGRSLIISWKKQELAQANSILVIYSVPQQLSWISYLLAAVLLLTIPSSITAYYYLIHKKKEKKKSDSPIVSSGMPHPAVAAPDLTRNLFEEEKAIVDALLKAKDREMWQKALLFEIGISKVRLSRKLRALESKGLIEKVPFGNTNKIRLKIPSYIPS
jgi:uncharacterized membrane protein